MADSVTDVPVAVGCNWNGEFGAAEHAGRLGFNALAQVVLLGPGPRALRSKLRPGAEAKVIKLATGNVVVAEFRSKMVPVCPGPSVPPEKEIVVPVPVWIQPLPPPAGSQSIVVAVTVTPSPVQFATSRWPITVAEALGASAVKAITAKAARPPPKSDLIVVIHLSF